MTNGWRLDPKGFETEVIHNVIDRLLQEWAHALARKEAEIAAAKDALPMPPKPRSTSSLFIDEVAAAVMYSDQQPNPP